jgi:ribose/xylose/arabinose/galactoside ABC-type transport system permease subunit
MANLRCLVAIVLSVLLSLTYGFWLHLWYIQTFLVCLFVVFIFCHYALATTRAIGALQDLQ